MLSIKRNNTAKTYQGTIDTMCADPAAGVLQVSSASGATCLRGRQRLRPKDRRHRSTGALATVRCGIPPWLGICNSILPQLFQTNPYVQLIIQARVEIGNWSRKCCSLRCFQTQMCKCTLELKCNNSKWTTMSFLKDDLQDMKQPTPCNFGIQNCLFCRRCTRWHQPILPFSQGCQDLLHQPFSGFLMPSK